jgi:bacillithiol system protein YtxJ
MEVDMKLYFKHSTRCPVSAGAQMEVNGFLKVKPENVDFELVDVIADSNYSNHLAETLGIPHESPQVILVDKDDKVLWHESHRRVTKKKILAAIEENR